MTQPSQPQNAELWHQIFALGHPKLQSYQRFNKRLPSPPRCKLCSAPFRGIGGVVMAMTGRRPSNRNPRFCSRCDHFIRAFPGGAEVEMSMLFADVRGSTSLAERVSATEYGRLMNAFYAAATAALVATDGFVIDVVGDEVVGLYPPGFSGPDHARKAIHAARDLLAAAGRSGTLPIGVAVHTGVAFIGTVSGAEEGIADVRALGDSINTAARLASQAAPGEALISDAACAAAGQPMSDLDHRNLVLKGKAEPVGVRVLHAQAV